jgi:hypothetical protein
MAFHPVMPPNRIVPSKVNAFREWILETAGRPGAPAVTALPEPNS